MSELIALTNLTMSSREIAELTDKRHDHVIRDIEKMLADLNLAAPKFGGSYIGADGTKRKCYNLNKELTYTLIAGYKVKLRNVIIRRWMELEAQPAHHIPQTLPEALRLAAEQAERVALLEPKAAALESITQSPDDLGVRDAGRELGIGQTRLAHILIERRWACREGSRSKLKAAHYGLSKGYVRFVTRCYTDQSTGEDRLSDVTVLTRKGLTRMAEIVAKEGVPA